MQLTPQDLKPEDVEGLGYIPRVPTGKELYEAEKAIWEDDPYYPNHDLYVKYLDLKKIEYAWTLYKPRYIKESIRETDRDYLLHTISQAVWGFENKTVYIEYPETWWDAFKNRWFPEWLLRVYPTYWIEWCIDSKTLYPLLDIQSTSHTHTLVYHEFEEHTCHHNKSEPGLTFKAPKYYNYKPKWYAGILKFVKDCIPQ